MVEQIIRYTFEKACHENNTLLLFNLQYQIREVPKKVKVENISFLFVQK